MNALHVKTNLKAGGINCDNCLAECQKGYDNRSGAGKINFWNDCSETCLNNRAEEYSECVNLGITSDICDQYLCPSNPKPR